MRSTASTLGGVSAGLADSWKGANSAQDVSAAAAFQDAWRGLNGQIGTYAENLDTAAKQLDDVADNIEHAQQEAARLKEMMLASLAVGGLLTVVSFGMSDEAAAAAVAIDTAEATSLMEFLDELLDAATTVLQGLMNALIRISARFVMGMALSWVSEAGTKLLEHENPLDPANYSAADFANLFLGGILTAGLGEIGAKVLFLRAFLTGRPIAGAAAYGALGGAMGSYFSQTAIEGRPANMTTLAESAAISAISGGALGAGNVGYGKIAQALGSPPSADPQQPGITGITGGDVLRGSIGIPSGGIIYFLNYPKAPAQPSLQAPQGRFADPAAAPTPTAVAVTPGGNLWQLTGGNPQAIAQIANLDGIPNDNLIYPGEILIIPPPSGSAS